MTALGIAQDGLDYLHENFVFERDGVETSVRKAMQTLGKSFGFKTAEVKGQGEKCRNQGESRKQSPELLLSA